MKNYVGIDLGTTNSAICSYDGEETRIWKSPEQNDVTPSAILFDKRGNKHVGKRAYDQAPQSPDNAALLFKRMIGTNTKIDISCTDTSLTPEECSSEILKVLFAYLPEEVRNSPDTGTVITVPAAFNQMQKDATMEAADMAGLGNVALLQEPVAAVMSVMRSTNSDGIFLIYDLGGGTLDIAIAESIKGRVSVLANGGIAMCGGRDFDRLLIDNFVKPWLLDKFNLPEDLSINPKYKSLMRLAAWAAEKSKIELSSRNESVISLSEMDIRLSDEAGEEIYIDIPITREDVDNLFKDQILESIEPAREILKNAGLESHDVERVVFIGGPTNYKPLRDMVSFELGLPSSSEVNPMTAVAEGAALFAESIDWSTKNRGRKNNRAKLSSKGDLSVTVNYIARTSDNKAKVGISAKQGEADNVEYQIDSLESGWSSGRSNLEQNPTIDLNLTKSGDNHYKLFVFNNGSPVDVDEDKIVITKTAATVDAIPASHSIGVEVLEKIGGRTVLEYLVKAGDSLPKKGNLTFKSGESLKAGGSGAITFKMWEGEITDPVIDNRYIGMMSITGNDFEDGVIAAGESLECEFEVLDSGNITLEVTVPSIGGIFNSGRNFYSRQEGQIDFNSEAAKTRVIDDASQVEQRIDEISKVVNDPKLEKAKEDLDSILNSDTKFADSESTQKDMDRVYEIKKLLAETKKGNQRQIRELELNGQTQLLNDIKDLANPNELNALENLLKTAQREIDHKGTDFENIISEFRSQIATILTRQDWYIVEHFKQMLSTPHLYTDEHKFNELKTVGLNYLESDNIDGIRKTIHELYQISMHSQSDENMLDITNIIRG